MTSSQRLFEPITVGSSQLQHRVVMAPLTRFRADDNHVPTEPMVQYYAQRASEPGTLLLTEATFISPRSAGYANIPGLWTAEQLDAWKKVTDAVHAKGSKIWVQLWALGRAAEPGIGGASGGALYEENFMDIVSASDIPMQEGLPKPRPLNEDDIWGYVEDYARAAKNAVERAGFDGVEIHGANGYVTDSLTIYHRYKQFLLTRMQISHRPVHPGCFQQAHRQMGRQC